MAGWEFAERCSVGMTSLKLPAGLQTSVVSGAPALIPCSLPTLSILWSWMVFPFVRECEASRV